MPYVFLAVPHYGQIVANALESLIAATTKHRIHMQTVGGSLLAYCFNSLWCHALNKRKDGITHFVMHHSDINAEPCWLDKLVEEQQAQKADILSVVIPIKDKRGVTSTARMRPDGQIVRLTVHEIHNLPATFSGSSVQPDTLLVNTGLMIVDFTKPWVENFSFNIADGIKKLDSGRYAPLVLPEDWNMSLWAHHHNLKVHATRKVKATHWGPAGFSNDQPGDWQTDQGDTF